MTNGLTFAQAIRRGAEQTKPIRGTFYGLNGNGYGGVLVNNGSGRWVVSTCAIGAALVGEGIEVVGVDCVRASIGNWPELETMARCPVCNEAMNLLYVVNELFECHKWDRERIADWVEAFENAQAANDAKCTRGEGNLHAIQERVDSPELVTA